jgi:hypothetical protein
MDFKTASLGELLEYWEGQRTKAEEKLRHLYALLGDEGESVAASGGKPQKEERKTEPPVSPPSAAPASRVPVPRAADAPDTATDVPDTESASDSLMGRAFALLPEFINSQNGPFTRRDMMDFLESKGFQVTRQIMAHTVFYLKKRGVLVEHLAEPGGLSKYVYVKSALAA